MSSTGSPTDRKMIAPAPQGPGLGRHGPSVKANVVSGGASIVRPISTSLPSVSWSLDLDFDDPSLLQYSGDLNDLYREPSS